MEKPHFSVTFWIVISEEVNGNKKGLFTRNRQPKDAAYTMKKRWEKG